MKYLLTVLFTLSCCCQSFSLTADQLAGFLRINSWESEVQLPANSFKVEVVEFSEGKVGKPVTPTYDDAGTALQAASKTSATPLLIMWKPGHKFLEVTVTMGSPETGTQTRPGFPDACQNFGGVYIGGRVLKSIKEGDFILGGEPLEHDGAYRGTDDIKDYKRGLLLRISRIDIKGVTLNQMMERMQADAERNTSKQPGFRILQGFYGADDVWRDVTDMLQGAVKQNQMHLSWQQPYDEVGGDPAFGKIKTLLISYRMHGKTRMATFQEENEPIGLQATLP